MTKEKIVVLLVLFIDVLGLGIIIPILPGYAAMFGLSPFSITLLFSVYALFSFISAPFLGMLSDRLGRKPILVASVLSTSLGWIIFALAKTPLMLFLGRIIDGLAAGNMTSAQGFLVDMAKNEKERTVNLGLVGATFGLGLTIGPALGGLLYTIDPTAPFWAVGVAAFCNGSAAVFTLPRREKVHHHDQPISFNPLAPIVRAIKDKKFFQRYLIWSIFGLALAGQQAVLALYVHDVFGVGPTGMGYILAIAGIVLILNQGLIMKTVWLKYFSGSQLELIHLSLLLIGFLLIDTRWLSILIIGQVLMAFGQSTFRVVFQSDAVEVAGERRRGEVLGILNAFFSLTMIVGPLVAGLLYARSVHFPFLVSAVLLAVAVMWIWKGRSSIVTA